MSTPREEHEDTADEVVDDVEDLLDPPPDDETGAARPAGADFAADVDPQDDAVDAPESDT